MKTTDDEELVAVTIGYQQFLMPMRLGFMVFEGLSKVGCYRLDSHYDPETKLSTDILAKVDVGLVAVPKEEVAMRKLATAALEQRKRESGGG